MKRFLGLGLVAILFAILPGCGDIFRPIIIPNPPQFPNPAAAHTVVIVTDNGDITDGSAMTIDVSGDSVTSERNVGLHPVHMVQQSASQVLVVNRSDPTLPQDSLSKLVFSSTSIASVSTVTLPQSYDPAGSGNPASSAPNFVATTESSQAYVLLPDYQPNPQGGAFAPSVVVLNTNAGDILAVLPVSSNPAANPIAMAETADQAKLYVANQGDNSIAAFNTVGRTPRTLNGTFNAPLWIAARSDSQRVYVLNGNGVLSTLDTHLTGGPDTVIDSSISVPGAAYMWYDVILNRLYIPAAQQLTILDVSQSIPNVLATVSIPALPPTSRSSTDPCSATTQASPLSVIAATSLPDGSRAYVGAYYIDSAANVCPQVTVINTGTNSIKTATAVPGFPASSFCADPTQVRFRLMMAAGGDSSRAYLSSCDGGNVNIIQTSTDTYLLSQLAPVGAGPGNPPQNPTFMIAGP